MTEIIVEARTIITGVQDRHTPIIHDNAAVLVREPDLSAARLAEELDHWEADPEGLAAMATAARPCSSPKGPSRNTGGRRVTQ